MPLNNSGPISLGGIVVGQSIQLELGGNGTTQIDMNNSSVRSLASIPAGQISLSNFYGKSNISFGILSPSWYLGAGLPMEKVEYSTNTYSNSGITQNTINYESMRLTNSTTGLIIGGQDQSFVSKVNLVNGIYFSTLTKFSAAVMAAARGFASSSRYNDTGFILGGTTPSTFYLNYVKFNLITLTNSTGSNIFPYNSGNTGAVEGITNTYIPSVEFSINNSAFAKFNKSTEVLTLNIIQTGNLPLSVGVTSPVNGYFFSSVVTTPVGRKLIKSTETISAFSQFNPMTGYGYASWNPYVQSDLRAYTKGGYNTTNAVLYNLGFYMIFATETWVTGLSVIAQSGQPGVIGLDPYFIPTV